MKKCLESFDKLNEWTGLPKREPIPALHGLMAELETTQTHPQTKQESLFQHPFLPHRAIWNTSLVSVVLQNATIQVNSTLLKQVIETQDIPRISAWIMPSVPFYHSRHHYALKQWSLLEISVLAHDPVSFTLVLINQGPSLEIIKVFHFACLNGVVDIVTLLLDYGVSPDSIDPDEPDTTCALTAVKRGDVELVRLVVKYGADVNANYHVSLLQLSITLFDEEMARALIRLGSLGLTA